MVEARSLHSEGTVCIAQAWSAQWRLALPSKFRRLVSAQQRLMASGGSLPRLNRTDNIHIILSSAKSCGIQKYICNKKASFICFKFLYQISIKLCVHQGKTTLQNVCTVRGSLTILKARSGLMQWTTRLLCTAAVVKITSKSFQIIS